LRFPRANLPDAIATACARGRRFSLVMISRDRIFAARDPRGFAHWLWAHSALTSEKKDTVSLPRKPALLIAPATYERDVKPGELVIVGPKGSARVLLAVSAQSSLSLNTFIFRAPTVWCLAARSIKA